MLVMATRVEPAGARRPYRGEVNVLVITACELSLRYGHLFSNKDETRGRCPLRCKASGPFFLLTCRIRLRV